MNTKKYLKWGGGLWLFSTIIGFLIFVLIIKTFLYEPQKIQNRINQALNEDMPTLQAAIETYYSDKGLYPDRLEDLISGQNDRRYMELIPSDPWQKSYVYRVMENSYQLYSMGKNGVDESGLEDDVTNVEKDYSCEDYGLNCPYSKWQNMVIIAAITTAVIWIISGLVFVIVSALSLLAYFSRASNKQSNSTSHQSAYNDHNRTPQKNVASEWASKEVGISELQRLPRGYSKQERNGITKIYWRLNMSCFERAKSLLVLLVCFIVIWAILSADASWENFVDAELSPWEVLRTNMWSYEWWRTLFPLPLLPLIIGSFIAYIQLGVLLNRSTLTFSQHVIKFTTGPILWFSRGRLRISDIDHFYVENQFRRHNERQVGSKILVAKLKNNKRTKFVRLKYRDSTWHGIDYLVKESNAALGK